jgi:hypothetical protein
MPYSEAIKRKYQVFISSTFQDLREHRQHAILGIIRAGHMPVALENFPPSSEPKKEVIRQALKSCQFYVIILGARYGSIPEDNPTRKGYVEIELEMAKELGLKILAFVMDMNKVYEIRKTDDFQKSIEAKLTDKYEALRNGLTRGVENIFYKPFETAREIETELYAYFNNIQSEVRGYILEPEDRKDTEILQIYARNEIIRDVVQRLGQFETVEPRLASEAEKKILLAKAFADLWGDYVRDKYRRVFLESGSTITYVAKALVNYLPKKGRSGFSTEVITNNAFAYLYLWLYSGIRCHPVPSGSPDNKYGGMYGELTGRQRMPTYDLRSLREYDPEALEMIQRLSRETFGETSDKKTLILAAISGIQLTDNISAFTLDSNLQKHPLESNHPLMGQLSQCRGFHVGSYENHLFKRSYYLTKYPAIVFVHDKKIDCEIIIGKCHFLCDSEYQWDKFIKEYPLSICVACTEHSYQDILHKFHKEFTDTTGWTFGVYGLGTPFPIVIGHNEAFKKSCNDIGIKIPILPAGYDIAQNKPLEKE